MLWGRVLAVWAILLAAAPIYFFVFWHWFDFWTRRRNPIYLLGAIIFGAIGVGAVALHEFTFAGRIDTPLPVQVIGWAVLGVATALGTVADRQIGLRVRSFTPFFERVPHLDLVTTAAYGIVRHPIYTAGSGFQLGLFLVTGYPSVFAAWIVFTAGALWFTRQEEQRLVALLDDPTAYEAYRARVPALFPTLRSIRERGRRRAPLDR